MLLRLIILQYQALLYKDIRQESRYVGFPQRDGFRKECFYRRAMIHHGYKHPIQILDTILQYNKRSIFSIWNINRVSTFKNTNQNIDFGVPQRNAFRKVFRREHALSCSELSNFKIRISTGADPYNDNFEGRNVTLPQRDSKIMTEQERNAHVRSLQ